MAYEDNRDAAAGLNGTSTARDAAAVVPSDATDMTKYPRALFVGTAGNVSIQPIRQQGADAPIVFKNVAAGVILPVGCRRVNSTGTTATDIVALF